MPTVQSRFVRSVYLLGVGAAAFAEPGRTTEDLERAAVAAALSDAGLRAPDVPDGATTGGREALQRGWDAVAHDAHDVVLCVGVERTGGLDGRDARLEAHARVAERYMTASGATPEHLARIAAQDRRQGSDNPRSLDPNSVDIAAVLASEIVAGPLRRLMVAPPAGGAAAVVLASGAACRRLGVRAPRVRASVLVHGDVEGTAIHQAARRAYRMAGSGPDDIDCAEIADLSAAGEIAAYEALQFAPEGQGPELVDSGFTALGGVLPVNTSGGPLALGEAAGAAGIAQLCELAWQLRGDAGRRQVAGARMGLALCRPPAGDNGEPPLVSLTVLSAS
jgi:acetyl-CoA acetyltransferase